MKTTLNLRDDLVRRAKARAAMRGQPLARYIEEGLEQRLRLEEAQPMKIGDWVKTLPKLPPSATKHLKQAVDAADFREIDPSMWQ